MNTVIPHDGVGCWQRSQDDAVAQFQPKVEFLFSASFVQLAVCPFKRSFRWRKTGRTESQLTSLNNRQFKSNTNSGFLLFYRRCPFLVPLCQQHLGNRKEGFLVSIKGWRFYAHGAVSSAGFGVFLSGVQASSLGGISLASPLRVTVGRGTEIPAVRFLQQSDSFLSLCWQETSLPLHAVGPRLK